MKIIDSKTVSKRGSGILLPLFSLPSRFGLGDFGPEAYRFVDILFHTKQRYWQVLPLNPIDYEMKYSPYSSHSAFAGNIFFISFEILLNEHLLEEEDIGTPPVFSVSDCDYEKLIPYKLKILDKAFNRFKKMKDRCEFDEFCQNQSHWLDDYALYSVLKKMNGNRPWNQWPEKQKKRDKDVLYRVRGEQKEEIEKESYFQFLFWKQWQALKTYCHQRKIEIIGDMPIYVHYDSSDTWCYPDFFKLDENYAPLFYSGTPPDYFSKIGQLWRNPVFDWAALKDHKYHWWLQRIKHNLKLFDIIRIDHFRGFVAFWEVPSVEENAMQGHWRNVPVYDFFDTLIRDLKKLPLIAEDLGLITQDVKEAMQHYGFPGMKVILFAFDEDNPEHPYLPHNYSEDCVAYTGTHDNNTIIGWYKQEAGQKQYQRIKEYIGDCELKDLNNKLIRILMMSVAKTVIIPIQDILGLDETFRINTPSTTKGNWRTRFASEQISVDAFTDFTIMTNAYGRSSDL